MTRLPLLKQQVELNSELRRALQGSMEEPSAQELGLLTSKLSAALALPLAVPAAKLGAASATKVLGLTAAPSARPLWKLGVGILGGVVLGVGLSAAATATFSATDSPTPTALAPQLPPAQRPEPAPEAAAPADTAAPIPPSPASSVPLARRAAVATGELVLPEEDELSLLHRAQQALRAEPARALQLATQHETAFPQGALAQERDVIEIEALLRLLRLPEAEASARSFARKYPGSAHSARVEQLLHQAGSR